MHEFDLLSLLKYRQNNLKSIEIPMCRGNQLRQAIAESGNDTDYGFLDRNYGN
jgi:hypothetical protein